MQRSTILALALSTLAACGGSTTDPVDTTTPPQTGVSNTPGTTNRTVTVQGLTREFVVHVGATVGAKVAVPIVFMNHGTSGDGPQFFNTSGWREKADAEGFIAVFPSALTHCLHEDENNDGDFTDAGEQHVTTKWAHGELGDPARMPLCTAAEVAALIASNRALVNHPLADDLAFFDAMVSYLKQNYVVDPKAIYVSGFSNGSQMANRLAVDRSVVFAATAGHAGGISVPTIASRAISAVLTLGTRDDRVLTPLAITAIPLGESTLAQYPLIPFVFIQPMLTQLRLTSAYIYDEPTINGKRASRWTFRTSTVGASNSLSFTLLEDNTHSYPNGSNHPVVMANVLWPFFKAQRLP
ncbi:MAG: PHB depolymerase family esterase [Gemmatimonas sp.]